MGFGRNLQLGLLEMISGLFPVFAGEFSTPSACYVKDVIVAGIVVRGARMTLALSKYISHRAGSAFPNPA
jgi:hypothetical protein